MCVAIAAIAMDKNAIGRGLACEEYGDKFFANGAAPSGVLEHPGVIKDVARCMIRGMLRLVGTGMRIR